MRLVTDNTGEQIYKLAYDGFGNIASESNAANVDRFKYAGYQLDGVTGLDHTDNREYNPATGDWTVRDPIGFDGGSPNL